MPDAGHSIRLLAAQELDLYRSSILSSIYFYMCKAISSPFGVIADVGLGDLSELHNLNVHRIVPFSYSIIVTFVTLGSV
jgi:hypothetical protein